MAKRRKNKKQPMNPQRSRAAAAPVAEMPAAETLVEESAKAEETTADPAADVVEIVDLPEDPLAEEAIKQMEAAQVPGEAEIAIEEPAESASADTGVEAPAGDDAGVTNEEAVTVTDETPAEPDGKAAGKHRKKLPIWGRILLGFAIVLLLIVGIGVGIVGHFLSRIGRVSDEDMVAESVSTEDYTDEEEESEDAGPLDTMDPNDITWYGQTIEPMQDDDIKNILLIGQDRREGESRKRSDAMVIVSLNQKTGKIKVCSLMRDTYVQIPGYGGNKLNYAYEKGGMELLDQTIEENLGVTIDNNVEVDFNGFVEAMSVVGNLDIYLSQAEIDFMEAHPTWADDSGADVTTWDLHEGLNSMTPSEYAVFCRLRMIGNNDFERTERQRRVLSAAFNKVMDGGILYELSVADAIIPYITTDMTNGEILGYVYTVVTKGMELSGQYRIPLDNTWTNQTINRAAVLVCDMETNTKALQEFLYGDEEGVAFTSEEDRATEKESGTFTTDSYSSTTSGGSQSGYSGTSSGYSSSTTTQTPVTTEETTPAAEVDGTAEMAVDPATTLPDVTGLDVSGAVTDPAAATDTSGIVADPTAAAVQSYMDATGGAIDADAAAAAAAASAAQTGTDGSVPVTP